MLKYDIINVIFVSSRGKGRQEHQVHKAGTTVNITVPSDLVLRLLPEGAILQVQIAPVPYTRQDSAWPLSKPISGRSPGQPSGYIQAETGPFPLSLTVHLLGKSLPDLNGRRRK